MTYQSIPFLTSTPTTITKIKKPTILSSTTGRLVSEEPPRLVTMVRAIRPRMSSIRAAARMVLPTTVLSLPISLRASTVMETEVAVRMTPMKTFCISTFCAPESLKKKARDRAADPRHDDAAQRHAEAGLAGLL